ncbi:hypothetical protein [Amycolatopsis anabasis]|uniref:hypothetical protein n=1 Tax=Amycolatopsis anabasis TaxID=1840409 RepID=UPI001C5527C9|nr:hypothetical protein [Amycolatopsis anabasis]
MTGTVRVVRPPSGDEDGGWLATTSIPIAAEEPVFAGHYPGFPIFPGLCVVDCVDRSARLAAPPGAGGLTLAGVESIRFVGAVHPGDGLTIDLSWNREGESWRCAARARTERAEAATVRLRYHGGGRG